MNLKSKELKQLMYDFNRVSERLMHTDFADFSANVGRFVSFIDGNNFIREYIGTTGNQTLDINKEMEGVSDGHAIFDIGNDESSEVANIYAILHYIIDNGIEYNSMIFYGYAHGSTKYQDMIDGFNSRVTFVLISHIEAYLTKMGYELGLDQQIKSINNNFYGTINTMGMQQGNNNTLNNNSECIDYDSLKSVLSEIINNKDSFDSAFGERSEEFAMKLDQLIELVDKQTNPSLIKKVIEEIRGIAVAAGGNLLAAGVFELLRMY